MGSLTTFITRLRKLFMTDDRKKCYHLSAFSQTHPYGFRPRSRPLASFGFNSTTTGAANWQRSVQCYQHAMSREYQHELPHSLPPPPPPPAPSDDSRMSVMC